MIAPTTTEGSKRHPSWLRYVVIWLCLLALTSASFLLSLAHLGAVDVVVALGIAVAKSSLVLLFFMHLLEHRFSNAMIVLVSCALVVLLVSLVAADVATRHTFPPAPAPLGEPD